MQDSLDFDRIWLERLSTCLGELVGQEIRRQVMAGSEVLSSQSPRPEVIEWTNRAMTRLESLVDEEKCIAIMAGCACQYPKSDLQEMKETYAATNDIGLVHQMLQEQFESFLKNVLKLDDALFRVIVERGWGAAGVRHGDTIMATKIPKSGNLVAYMNEPDPGKRRQLYCHCPRVRDALISAETISPTYCYCGAGFYSGIWEEILQQPVRVEVSESVLNGDEVCRIAVHLPPHADDNDS